MSEISKKSMTNYEKIALNRQRILDIECSLKALRDEVGELTKREINNSLKYLQSLDGSFHLIDKALEIEKLGSVVNKPVNRI
jgi:hypothetical protein